MEPSWGVTGHQKQRDFLSRLAASNRLAHAYIFSGPEGVGKRTVALALAKILLCEKGAACGQCGQCKMVAAGSNPDLILLAESEGIRIEHIRDLVYKLSLRSYSGGKKLAIIDSAEQMTTEAANALLKGLEEPVPGTHVILITPNAHRLLPTISSRAQKISFGLVPDAEYVLRLPEQLGEEKIRMIMDLSGGRPGVAMKMALEPFYNEIFAGMENFFDAFQRNDQALRIQAIYELAEKETPEIRLTLEHTLNKLERELLLTGSREVAKKAAGVSSCLRYMSANVNPKLFLFNLALNV